jgi:aspartyl-tRNA synthetase
MLWYGSDKPDLRNPIKMQVVSEHFAGSGFKIFASLLETQGNEVRAIPAPGGGSRKFCDRMNAFAQGEGLPGMGYIFWRKRERSGSLDRVLEQIDNGDKDFSEHEALSDPNVTLTTKLEKLMSTGDPIDKIEAKNLAHVYLGEIEAAGPLAKNIGPERTEAIRVQLGLDEGDAAFFLGGKPSAFQSVAGKARDVIGRELGLTAEGRFDFCWIVDFPMYERDEETGALDFSHNPFSMPQGGLEALEASDPLDVLGYQYDIVCNGVELSSGAVRNHKPDIMYKAFEIVGHDKAFVDDHFGGMLSAFRYGAPPHAGIAPGIDRMVMLLADAENIREVIMFPMNQRAEDLMMGAPAAPTNEQLRELGLRLAPRT